MLQGPGQFRNALKSLLDAQGACAHELLETLESERSALESGDAERLDAVTAQKSSLLRKLDQLGRDQMHLLGELSFDEDGPGLEQALAWCDPGAALKSEQQEVGRCLQRCRDLNERNGITVQYRLGYVRRALDVLNGQPAGSSDVYGADGRTSTSCSSRLLASG